MTELRTNWNVIKQQMLDETSKVIRNFNKRVINNLESRLKKKGLDPGKIVKSSEGVSFITDDEQEYELGKVYFDEAYKEMSDKKWLESIL